MKLQIIIASTRPGRAGKPIATWFEGAARAHGKFEIELVDLLEVNLPILDEAAHPRLRQYEHAHTKAWSEIVDRADAYVIVTPEYNFSSPPALLNALSFLVAEWAYKPVGFVSYGGVSGGLRSVQMTKLTLTALKMMPIPDAVTLSLFSQYLDKETGVFTPLPAAEKSARAMLDELERWAGALKPLRSR